MTEDPLFGLTSILVLGVLAQWLAWRLRLPSILLLLLFGFIVGPLTGILNPTALLDDLLFPLVSLSVAVIIFEGGLSLEFAEVRETRRVVRRLISLGVLVTWVIAALAAYWILKLELSLAILLGALLTVSGPTVVTPLLRHVRATDRVSSALKWEGILVDPVGATLAVLVFEAVIAGHGVASLPLAIGTGVLKTLLVGSITGLVGAVILYVPLRRYWIPDHLQSPMVLMVMIASFVTANILQEESGLLTATVMGIFFANQRRVRLRNIIKFKENLVMLLLSSVFILLAARLKLSDLSQLGTASVLFLLVLIFIARPAAAFVSTIGSQLTWRERAFVAAMAPRGIVAAAVSAVFALELSHHGYAQAEQLASVTFFVIIGTVSFYSLSAGPIARWLKISQDDPQGIIFVGAHSWVRDIALALHNTGTRVLMIDSNYDNIQAARMLGLPVYFGSILSESLFEDINLNGIGRILAMTSNDEVNSLAMLHFAEVFDSAETYQLSPHNSSSTARKELSVELHGRFAFGPAVSYDYLDHFCQSDVEVRTTPLTDKFDYRQFKAQYQDQAIPLFLLSKTGSIEIFTDEARTDPLPGQSIISLVRVVGIHEMDPV